MVGSGNRIRHGRHASVVIGRHIHGHARLGWVRSSGSLGHVLRVHPTAAEKQKETTQICLTESSPALITGMD